MNCRVVSVLAFTCVAALSSAQAQTAPRALLELFTSQGCSSCPAADKLLAEIAHDPNILAMTLAVDYWDYIGWKDTLALAGHAAGRDQRHRARARQR